MRIKRTTADGKNDYKFPLKNYNYQTLIIQQKVFGSKFEKGKGYPLGFFIFFGPNCFFMGSLI